MKRTDNTIDASCVVPLAIPAGAIVMAAPPELVGEANAGHMGMEPAQLRAVLLAMRADPAFASCVMAVKLRPLVLVAAPRDVVRFLRGAAAALGPANDAQPVDGADAVLAEMGLKSTRRARR
jgi:hypothetical protein